MAAAATIITGSRRVSREAVAAGVISAGHARAILMLSEPDAMERLATRIVAEGLSVRAAEEIVAVGEHGAKRAPRSKRRKS